jgi:kynureninase
MSLSGAVKYPRLSDHGVTFSMGSIFSVGSMRSRFEEACEYASALIMLMATIAVVHKFSLDEIRTQSIQRGAI